MWLTTAAAFTSMDHAQVTNLANTSGVHAGTELSTNNLRKKIMKLQRTLTLAVWHDHATLLGLGILLMTVHVVYDPAVFITQQEYDARKSKPTCVQSIIERPALYIITAGSSSVDDQASILPDRVDCLKDLTQAIQGASNIPIDDRLRFFIGDHPAQQFERGTQLGGHTNQLQYKRHNDE